MRLVYFVLPLLTLGAVVTTHTAQLPTVPASTQVTGDYANADIRVLSPGVVFSSGLPDIAAAFSKESGKRVGINTVGMGTIVREITTRNPPPDVIVLPLTLRERLCLVAMAMAVR